MTSVALLRDIRNSKRDIIAHVSEPVLNTKQFYPKAELHQMLCLQAQNKNAWLVE